MIEIFKFWSYPSPHRDQGQGKEICDLLVVFRNHIFIFSDKHIGWKQTSDLKNSWSRWIRKAFLESADQIYGAERWLFDYPDRVFLDKTCIQKIPVKLPNREDAIVHRIVVANGASDASKIYFTGGTGSLIFNSSIIGNAHVSGGNTPVEPFQVGIAQSDKGFVHVFDEANIKIVLESLDTVSDFAGYLLEKERFIESMDTVFACSEEDMLAFYLSDVDVEGKHGFSKTNGKDNVVFDSGHWFEFSNSLTRIRQVCANENSYKWDRILIQFLDLSMTGSLIYANRSIADSQKVYEFMAAESRMKRRTLADALVTFISKTGNDWRGARVIVSTKAGEPYYVFFTLKKTEGISDEEHHCRLATYLFGYCRAVRLKYKNALDVIGISVTGSTEDPHSEVLIYMDGRAWDKDEEQETRKMCEDLEIFKNAEYLRYWVDEYPGDLGVEKGGVDILSGKGFVKTLNPEDRCFCKSGKKYKNCCLKQGKTPPFRRGFKKFDFMTEDAKY